MTDIVMGHCASHGGKVCSSICTHVAHIKNQCSKQHAIQSGLIDTIRHLIATMFLQASKELPAVKEMLKQAEVVLGYDLLQLCLEGPKEKLDDTVYSQPALFVAGLAAVEKLRQDNAQAVDNCSATAGKSRCKACMTGSSAAARRLMVLPLASSCVVFLLDIDQMPVGPNGLSWHLPLQQHALLQLC